MQTESEKVFGTQRPANSVFIATSLDGFIADTKGGLDWLNSDPLQFNLTESRIFLGQVVQSRYLRKS